MVLEAAKRSYAKKNKSPSLPRNLALKTFGKLPIVFSIKINLLYLLYSMAQRCCLLHLIKQNCLLKTFLWTLILMPQVSLFSVFLSRTNLKLHDISVTPKIVKTFTTNLNFSKVSGHDCIPMVVLKNCDSEVSYILLQQVPEGALFSRLVEEFIGGPCI